MHCMWNSNFTNIYKCTVFQIAVGMSNNQLKKLSFPCKRGTTRSEEGYYI